MRTGIVVSGVCNTEIGWILFLPLLCGHDLSGSLTP